MSIINRITTWGSQILTSSSLNSEFNNIINLLNNLDAASTAWTNVKGGTLTSTGAVTGVTVNGSTNVQKQGFNTVGLLQIAQNSVNTTATSTTSNSYTACTNMAITVTPNSTSSKILVFVSGMVYSANPTASAIVVTLKRGSTDLGNTNGFFEMGTGGVLTSSLEAPCSFMYLDSPSTTSATTYQVFIKNNDGTTNVQWNKDSGTGIMIVAELL